MAEVGGRAPTTPTWKSHRAWKGLDEILQQEFACTCLHFLHLASSNSLAEVCTTGNILENVHFIKNKIFSTKLLTWVILNIAFPVD